MAEHQTDPEGPDDGADDPLGESGPATRPSGTDDPLVDELRALTRTRSATQFHDHSTPVLDDLVRAEAGPTTDRQPLIDRGIAAIPYPQYREAARALLGSGADRWQPLAKRGEAAASMFEVGYDGFRRAKTTGPSLLDETLGELARATRSLVAATTAAEPVARPDPVVPAPAPVPPAAGPSPSPSPAPPTPPPVPPPVDPGPRSSSDQGDARPSGRGRRRRVALVLMLAALLAIGVVFSIVALTRSDSDPAEVAAQDEQPSGDAESGETSTDEPSPGACTGTIVQPDDPELVPYAEAFGVELASLEAQGTSVGCPTGAIQRWDAFVFQQFTDGSRPTGVLAAVNPDDVIWFTEAQWGSYHQVGGKSGDNAQALIGLAQAPEQRDGYVVIPTDTDSILVGETPESPFFFVLGPARLLWEQEGGAEGSLGIPTSNPVVSHGALTQDFVGGSMVQAPDGSIAIRFVTDPGAELPPLTERAEGILRQTDATSWYVGADDRRYWIADGEMWDCKGGADALVANDVPGYAIASLPYGGPATC